MLSLNQVEFFLDQLAQYAVDSGARNLPARLRKHIIQKHLDLAGGNQCKVARLLNVHRNTLTRTMDELGIPRKQAWRRAA